MLKRNKEKGITLIALVVTIIVLLILAAVSLAMLTGENGILTNAKLAKENTTKGQLQEELQMAINEIQLEKTKKGEPLTKKDIAEYLGSSKGAIIIDYTDKIIDGECGDYQFIVDENNKVTVGGKLTGAKPIPTITPLDTAEGIESARIQVTATITEGEIASIESMDGLMPTVENGNADKTFTVTSNGEYKFKITGTNGRMTIGKVTISNIARTIEAESLLQGIEEIKWNGITNVRVQGINETKTYKLDVIWHDGDLKFGEKLISGKNEIANLSNVSYTNKTWTIGNEVDINSATVVLKVEGNISVEDQITVTSVKKDKSGPLGMIVYSPNELTLNGTISMTGRRICYKI